MTTVSLRQWRRRIAFLKIVCGDRERGELEKGGNDIIDQNDLNVDERTK